MKEDQEPEFEVDVNTLNELRQQAMQDTRAHANLVDGDIVKEDDES